jgi:hypothetical protein
MKKIVLCLVMAAFLVSAVPAFGQFPCYSQTCCICTKHFGCVRPSPGQWGTYACEEQCTGGPLPLDCMALPPPANADGEEAAPAWRFLTQEEYESQFMSVDPMLVASCSTPFPAF